MKINFRPLFIVAISLILGIVCLASFNFNNTGVGIFALVVIITLMLTFAILFLLSLINKNNRFFSFIKKFKPTALCVLIGTTISVASFYTILTLFNSNENITLNNVTLSGRICDVKNYNNYMVVNLDNVKIDGKDISGNSELSITKSDNAITSNIVNGNYLSLTTDLYKVNAGYETVYKIVNNIKYSSSSFVGNITITNANKTVKDVIKQNVLNNLTLTLNADNANLAYSMLFGEKDNLSDDVYNAFSYSGLAHILAVSGLHIGFLVALLVGLLNLLKCNKHLKNIIIFIILFLYAYLTNFTPSVVRAVIMSLVLLFSKTYNKEYDALSSLSLAAIIILIFSPFSLFTVGFQLSFACVFAIITLAPLISDCFVSIKFPKRLADALAISLAVNIGVFSITAHHFNVINFVSVISNIIVLPLFSVCYMFLFVFGFIGAITNVFNFMLTIPNLILHFIKIFANFIAEINFLNIKVFSVGYLVISLMLLALFIIKFLITKPKIKCLLSSALIVIAIVITLLTNMPATFNSYNLMASYSRYGNNAVLTTNKNETILVLNNLNNFNYVSKLLDKSKLHSVDAVILYGYSVKDNDTLNKIVKVYKPKIMVFEDNYKNQVLNEFSKKASLQFYNNNFALSDLNFSYIKNDFNTIALKVEINSELVLFVADNISKTDCYYFLDDYNYVISNNNNIDFKAYDVKYKNLITYRETKVLDSVKLNSLLFFTKTF